jgi:hypothetical protein
MEYMLMIDRCFKCGAPIYWDEENSKRVMTCPCAEKDPNCVSDGCCEGTCGCFSDDDSCKCH